MVPRTCCAKAPAKKTTHRALDDMRESVAELAYYRRTIFAPRRGRALAAPDEPVGPERRDESHRRWSSARSGRTGMRVSPLCLGAMMFGAWGNPDHDDCVRIVHAALDAGINFIDTADVYSAGESEEIVAKALAGGRRDNVILATKVHAPMGADPNMAGNSRRWIMREVESSLRRLQHGLDRPLPDPPARPHAVTSTTPWGPCPTWSTRARSGPSAARPSPAT